jgi:hypothetical protein
MTAPMFALAIGCSAIDQSYAPNAQRDVMHRSNGDGFRVNYRRRDVSDAIQQSPQDVEAYLRKYDLIPSECNGRVEVFYAGWTESGKWGYANFRCAK